MEAEVYQEMHRCEDSHWWFVARRMIIRRVLNHFNGNRSGHILEVGCGTGGNLAMLAEYGQLCALEMDATARQMAAARHICEVRHGILPEELPYAHNFNSIAMFDVLEHIDDDAATLKFLYTRLNKGGRLFLTVPAYPFLWSQHDVANHHKRRYVRPQLQEKLQTAGFRVLYAGYFNTFLFPVVLGVRLFHKLQGKDEGSDLATPAAPVNRLLTGIFGSERWFIPGFRFPFGVSILAVAEKLD